MKGKDKCRLLKEIRAQIAAANDIEWVTEHCAHKGDCRGTCPKCEAEVAALERALERRRALGKTVAVAGLAAGLVVSGSGCALLEVNETAVDGDMAPPSERVTSAFETEAVADELQGDIALFYYYYTDFVLSEARTVKAKQAMHLYGVITDDSGGAAPDGIAVSEGTVFEIVGEAASGQWLICYEDCYYCLWADDLDQCVQAVE